MKKEDDNEGHTYVNHDDYFGMGLLVGVAFVMLMLLLA